MRKLNTHNYEEWALDFLEGKLTESEVHHFKAFLLVNPEVAADLDLLQDAKENLLEDSKEEFELKEKIKFRVPHHLAHQSWDDLMIGVLENDLPEKDKRFLLAEFENNPGLKKDWALYQLTKVNELALEKGIDKSILYRKPAAKIIALNRPFLYRAAIVVLILGIGLRWMLDEIGKYQSHENGFALVADLPLMELPNQEINVEPKISNESKALQQFTHQTVIAKESLSELIAINKKPSLVKILPNKPVGLNADLNEAELQLNQRALILMEAPGKALASTNSDAQKNNNQYFDLNRPVKSLTAWVKREGNKRLDLPEGQKVEVPGSVEYASAGAALLEKLTGKTFALEPKFNKDGKMNDLSLRAGNYQLMLK